MVAQVGVEPTNDADFKSTGDARLAYWAIFVKRFLFKIGCGSLVSHPCFNVMTAEASLLSRSDLECALIHQTHMILGASSGN